MTDSVYDIHKINVMFIPISSYYLHIHSDECICCQRSYVVHGKVQKDTERNLYRQNVYTECASSHCRITTFYADNSR